MYLLLFLIIFPLVLAFVLLGVRHRNAANAVVNFGSLAVFVGTVVLLFTKFRHDVAYFPVESVLVEKGMLAVEILVGAFLFIVGIRAKKPLISLLVAAQVLLLVWFELFFTHGVHAEYALFVDKFSILMAAVVGIVGSLICLFSTGYMKDFHEVYHKDVKDRRPLFFFVTFLFLSAMFGVIFSNNLLWLYFFWEITTVCSFLLIGYKGNEESKRNALHALVLNLLGGLAFAVAIVYLYYTAHIIELDKLMDMGKVGALVPVVLMCIAGLTKSAQFPFSSWLLGAMVAPTPVSALLHSSTMVKAGVYIILRFSSLLEGTVCGFILALIGGITFLVTSLIAITQSDAKKILAYSTIANLGLIVLCAGVGTYEAAWAAMLLIIFHAVAKCLLFLCVGVVEHKLHSRNVEDMTGLIISMPKISVMLQIGMAGMFLAPFGMLISKWAALKALVDFNPLLAVFIVFGSAATLFFWVKWMGTLITVINQKPGKEAGVHASEWLSLTALSAGTIGVCGLFPLVSSFLVEPYVVEVYGHTTTMSQGNVVIMLIMLALVMLFPLSFFNYGKKVKVVDAYLAGANVDPGTSFRGSAGAVNEMQMQGYHLDKYFGEKRLFKVGVAVCSILILVMCAMAFI